MGVSKNFLGPIFPKPILILFEYVPTPLEIFFHECAIRGVVKTQFSHFEILISWGPGGDCAGLSMPTTPPPPSQGGLRPTASCQRFWPKESTSTETTCISTLTRSCKARHYTNVVWEGRKKIRGITVFSYPSPLGGVRPEKKYPTPMCKKVSQPQFLFLKNTTSCFFMLFNRSLHNLLRTPNIPYAAGTNLDPYISLSAQISATTKRGC